MVVGNVIYFVSDRNQGTVNLYRHDLATGSETQLTKSSDADLRWPATDGKSIVYEQDGALHAYDLATGRTEALRFAVTSDELSTRPYMLKVGNRISAFSLSPDGARIAVEARGEIFDVPVKGGDARNLTATPGIREGWPRWSPDGKTIAWLSDASGELQLLARPASGGEAKPVSEHTGPSILGFSWSPDGQKITYWTEDLSLFLLDPEARRAKLVFKPEYEGMPSFDWSPDGRWIALTDPVATGLGAIHLYEVATGKRTRVTDGFYDDGNVTFDRTGKYLYFTSARNFAPCS